MSSNIHKSFKSSTLIEQHQQIPSQVSYITPLNPLSTTYPTRSSTDLRASLTGNHSINVIGERDLNLRRNLRCVDVAVFSQIQTENDELGPQGTYRFLVDHGQEVWIELKYGQWYACIEEKIGEWHRVEGDVPVFCKRHEDIGAALEDLRGRPAMYVQQRIHVMKHRKSAATKDRFVYIGGQMLRGGGNIPSSAKSQEASKRCFKDCSETAWVLSTIQKESIPKDLKDIHCVRDVVEALNACQSPQDEERKESLQRCVEECIKCFQKQSVGELVLKDGIDIRDYGHLAAINIEGCSRNRLLLTDFINVVFDKIRDQKRFGDKHLIEVLEYILQVVDISVLEGDLNPLIILAKELLEKLVIEDTVYDRYSYPSQRSIFCTLYQVMMLIGKTKAERGVERSGDLYKKFMKKLNHVANKATYYPIYYHTQILQQSLLWLQPEGNQRFQPFFDRLGDFAMIAVYSYRFVSLTTVVYHLGGLSMRGFSFSDLQSGWEKIKSLFSEMAHRKRAWYILQQDLSFKCLALLVGDGSHTSVKKGWQEISTTEKALSGQDRKALRFGLTQQLCLLVLKGPTIEVRKDSLEKLLDLANQYDTESEVLEEVLNCLVIIAEKYECQHGEQEAARAALDNFNKKPDTDGLSTVASVVRNGLEMKKDVQEVLRKWNEGGLDEKIKSELTFKIPSSDLLSSKVKEVLGKQQKVEVASSSISVQEQREGPDKVKGDFHSAIFPPEGTCFSYYVKPGDTLWRLSLRFGTTVERLAEINHLRNPNLIWAYYNLWIPYKD